MPLCRAVVNCGHNLCSKCSPCRRLRAEVRALVAEVQDLRTAPLGSPLAMAEKWAGD